MHAYACTCTLIDEYVCVLHMFTRVYLHIRHKTNVSKCIEQQKICRNEHFFLKLILEYITRKIPKFICLKQILKRRLTLLVFTFQLHSFSTSKKAFNVLILLQELLLPPIKFKSYVKIYLRF